MMGFFDKLKRIAKVYCNALFKCDREDSNLWPSGSEPNALSS